VRTAVANISSVAVTAYLVAAKAPLLIMILAGYSAGYLARTWIDELQEVK